RYFEKIDWTPYNLHVPVPIIFDELPTGNSGVWAAVGMTSEKLGTLFVSRGQTMADSNSERFVPIVDENRFLESVERKPAVVEYDAEKSDLFGKLASRLPSSIVIARIPLQEDSGELACKLAREGVHGVHLYADYHGQDYSKEPRHISASLKEFHQQQVRDALRDQITTIARAWTT